jgi:SAM-dependent methyltransferase
LANYRGRPATGREDGTVTSPTNAEATKPAETSVDDFSVQWANFYQNDGYYASEELLRDYLEPFVQLEDLRGCTVAEVGCGNGRFIRLLAGYAERVIAVEPGDGIHNTREYCKGLDNVEFVHAEVYELPELPQLDHVFCIGVLHHMPDSAKALEIMKGLLRPGGHALIWVYGQEGNELYLAVFGPIRKITQKLPYAVLRGISTGLALPLKAYIGACRILPLPMRSYMRRVLAPLDFKGLVLNIYDQLNPKIAYYWTREEIGGLMEGAGFEDLKLHHRHGYSWTAFGRRP